LLVTLAGSAVVISVVLWWLQPELDVYRGLSGVDSALFLLAVVNGVRQNLGRRQWTHLALFVMLVAAFACKTGYETFQNAAVFVHTGDFVPVPLAHMLGALVGLLVGMMGGGAKCCRAAVSVGSSRRCNCRRVAGNQHVRADVPARVFLRGPRISAVSTPANRQSC
jgi:hypothetical protein